MYIYTIYHIYIATYILYMCVSACVFYVCNKCFYAFVFISDVKLRAHNFGVRLPPESQVQAYRELSEH